MFSVIRLEGYMNFFIGMFLQALHLASTTAVKTEYFEEGFLQLFLILHF